ncbi:MULTISPECIES: DUF5707 domain-containing protein [unclassified Streptomyces]|uniref:DUF5707 domain-containing protein n=1 Tax=unclassified Streptomyces TaxID=2593676 RepID=UPI001013B2EC|nr:DUF5707 domain-containing protein [Streptomyces sp. GZWMJZ-114]
MSKRLVVSSLVGAAAIAAGTLALVSSAEAAAPAKPEISKATARFTGTAGGGASLTFTATVADDSGVKNLRVLAWPASSHLDPTAGEMRDVEEATCKATSSTTSECTYAVKSSAKDAAALPDGVWHVSALATAKDHDTTFVPRAATFTVKR